MDKAKEIVDTLIKLNPQSIRSRLQDIKAKDQQLWNHVKECLILIKKQNG